MKPWELPSSPPSNDPPALVPSVLLQCVVDGCLRRSFCGARPQAGYLPVM